MGNLEMQLYRVLDQQFPNGVELDEVEQFLVSAFSGHRIVSKKTDIVNACNESVVLQFHLTAILADGRTVEVYTTGSYDPKDPSTGVDLIETFDLSSRFRTIASEWLSCKPTKRDPYWVFFREVSQTLKQPNAQQLQKMWRLLDETSRQKYIDMNNTEYMAKFGAHSPDAKNEIFLKYQYMTA
jgi:hypothetical protein